MSIIKNQQKKKSNFTVLDNTFIRDGSISLSAVGLMAQLYALPKNWNVTAKGLASMSSDSLDVIRKTLRELVKAGYVKRKHDKNSAGHFTGYTYTLVEHPKNKNFKEITVEERLMQYGIKLIRPGDQVPENQVLVFPDLVKSGLENPALENPGLEIPAQLNTEGINTEQLNTDVSNIFSPEAERFGKWRAPWREKKEKFTPPGVEEVRDFCLDRGISVDAEHFVNYYTANGWHIGRSRMKDWRSAVICWEKNGGAKAEPKRSDGGRYEKRKEGHMSSINAKDFFEAALRRSYGGMKTES